MKNFNWKLFKDFKLEFLVWTMTQYSLFNLLCIFPASLDQTRQILMGMNATLPYMASLVLRFSDFVLCWKIFYFPIVFCSLVYIWQFVIRTVIAKAGKYLKPDDNSYIKFQFKLLLTIILFNMFLAFLTSYLSSIIMSPMLRLVNVI